MYLSIDQPSRSLRSVTIDGEKMVLVGGESHKTGQGEDTIKHYQALESFAEGVLGIESIPYRWSAQDLITLDKIPYIGPIYPKEKRILVATGYRKWGMTTSTLAAQLMTDHIAGEDNPYQAVFQPARFHPDPSIKKRFPTTRMLQNTLPKENSSSRSGSRKTLSTEKARSCRMPGNGRALIAMKRRASSG